MYRFRYYEFLNDDTMRIHRPSPTTLALLKAAKFDLEKFLPSIDEFEYMKQCDIQWKSVQTPQHGFHGELVSKEAIIESESSYFKGKLIVKDSIFVFENEIHINDRVSKLDGTLIYGNSLGIPYKLKRIITT